MLTTRLGCVGELWLFGVLFGGIHNNRFKLSLLTMAFSTQSLGQPEEVFFSKILYPYWEKDNAIAQNLYHIQPY
jgi:hypothetical protein